MVMMIVLVKICPAKARVASNSHLFGSLLNLDRMFEYGVSNLFFAKAVCVCVCVCVYGAA